MERQIESSGVRFRRPIIANHAAKQNDGEASEQICLRRQADDKCYSNYRPQVMGDVNHRSSRLCDTGTHSLNQRVSATSNRMSAARHTRIATGAPCDLEISTDLRKITTSSQNKSEDLEWIWWPRGAALGLTHPLLRFRRVYAVSPWSPDERITLGEHRWYAGAGRLYDPSRPRSRVVSSNAECADLSSRGWPAIVAQ